ncbi:alpha-2-macroglobulin family protein [Phocaeicola plebeius]|uniref:alpha-2-macroglobulin family protein n=1 Tax=Phocaeicola plebeius TaxID=310297 RepID=UPI003AB12D33
MMNRLFLICATGLLAFMFPLAGIAQSYDRLWKEVEETRKKDLPQTLISQVNQIYEKARKEKNAPQMLKAYLSRVECQVGLTPDSLQRELCRLNAWAAEENDPLQKAVLSFLSGYYKLESAPQKVDSALYEFDRAVKDKEVLLGVATTDFRPMAEQGKWSQRYFGDNMYDLLLRQSIFQLLWNGRGSKAVQLAVFDKYEKLIAQYEAAGNRDAELLTRLERLMYWQRNGWRYPQQLSDEQVLEQLQAWAKAYDGVDACAALYVSWADFYHQKQDFVSEMKVIEEGIKRYPSSEFTADLKDKQRIVCMPSLSVQVTHPYPQTEAELRVTSKNLKGATLEWYRLNLKASSSVFAQNLEHADLIKKYGTLVDKVRLDLPDTPTYKDTVSVLTSRMPEAGIYILKSIPDGYQDKIGYDVVHLSAMQVVSFPMEGRQTECHVVDRKIGKPVAGAELVFYSIPVPGNYTLYKTFKTDKQGKVVVPDMKESLWMHACAGKDEFMQVAYWSRRVLPTVNDSKKKVDRMDLFTDRALYRKGQTVYVSGVAYTQEGDSVEVRKDAAIWLALRDANNREIARKELTTDDFGAFSAEFQLPSETLAGMFRIESDKASCYIRVEEYKRPTFEVTWKEVQEAYTMGDSLQLEGTAKKFSGAPVQGGKVRYTLTRSKAWFWRNMAGEQQLAEGELMTSADGTFAVKVCLERPDTEVSLGWDGFYRYQVKVDVTDAAGETQEGVLVLPVGEHAIGLQIKGLAGKVAREKLDKMQVQALNMQQQPVELDVVGSLYALDEAGKKQQTVWVDTVKSGQPFLPEAWKKLASGKYLLEVTASDEHGRPCRAEQEFVLFSLKDRVPPVKTVEWFYQDGTQLEETQPVTLYVGSSEKNVHLFYHVYSGNRMLVSDSFVLNEEIRSFDYTWLPEYGDGITVSFGFMKDGIWYSKQVALKRPVPGKKLTLKWEVFRDRLRPGTEETWTMQILDAAGKPVDARLLATLYDASLDRLWDNPWNFQLGFSRYTPSVMPFIQSVNSIAMAYSPFYTYSLSSVYTPDNWQLYSRLWVPSLRQYRTFSRNGLMVRGAGIMMKAAAAAPNTVRTDEALNAQAGFTQDDGVAEVELQSETVSLETEQTMTLRENFAETAFFYPDLRTDSTGTVRLVFTVPDALTQWKFRGLAHTRHMDYGLLQAETRTEKPFMIQPNLPRFLRRGDEASLAASLMNLSTEEVKGTVRLELVNPMDESVVYQAVQDFQVKAGETGSVRFTFPVNMDGEVLICRIKAEAGEFSDGEQHYLPVLTDKQWMTETLSLQVKGGESQEVNLKDLFNGQSKTAQNRQLTIELTSTPIWYAVQSLPVVGNPQQDDAFSWASAYYANAVARKIVELNPQIQPVFEAWKKQGVKKETLWSELEKNQELKSLLLAETPWLAQAADEQEQRQRMGLLFDLNTMNYRMEQTVEKLKALQKGDGSWSWFNGMQGSRLVTTQVVELLARLKSMHIMADAQVAGMYLKGLNYLENAFCQEYENLKKNEARKKSPQWPSELAVRYLYIASLDAVAGEKVNKAAKEYITSKLENRSATYSIYEKALIARILQAQGKHTQAEILVRSIKEYTVVTPEMGRYFDTPKAGYAWNGYRIPTQVAAMEAIQHVEKDEEMLEEMKRWLLKQKQVQCWNTPLATADAVYALLADGMALTEAGQMQAVAGNVTLETPKDGLGCISHTLSGAEAEMKTLTVSHTGKAAGWGAVYAQYLEDMDRVKAFEGKGLQVSREYIYKGKALSVKEKLQVGDKLTVRLTLRADRDMDFVCLKDERAACMEPVRQISGYEWSDGLGRYRVSGDAATTFFMDHLRKGTYVIEYEVHVDRSGVYQAGTSEIQSLYAPEFGSHTEGYTLYIE